MTKQQQEHSVRPDENPKRRARALRILSAAAELVQRWGYGKTTIDDIAREAGVAKGTIYLHWKTREDLFQALVTREELALADDIQRRIADDPEGTTLHGSLKHTVLALMKNPIMKALFLGDTDMLGEIARTKRQSALYQERLTHFKTYFEVLRSQGLVRSDLSIIEQVYVLSAITTGFLLVDPFLPDELKPSDEEAADLLAETIQRTFAPQQTSPATATEAGSQAFRQYFDHAVEVMRVESLQEGKREP